MVSNLMACTVQGCIDKLTTYIGIDMYNHKTRCTLITHPITGERVWAEVLTGHALCTGCSLREYPCVGLSPPCTARYRPDNREVIFVTDAIE